MKNLTRITLHGDLGAKIGETWNLAVKSVAESIHAIEVLTGKKLYKYLFEKDKEGVKYQVLINGEKFETDKPLDINNPETIVNSELMISNNNLKTIDIIPAIEGASDMAAVIGGILLIILGAILAPIGIGIPIILAGIALLANGITNLLSTPPKFQDFREVKGSTTSYLFNGPQNTAKEGGPVPIGYGRMIIGSQVITASYELENIPVENAPLTI